jgi:hypothetical protein
MNAYRNWIVDECQKKGYCLVESDDLLTEFGVGRPENNSEIKKFLKESSLLLMEAAEQKQFVFKTQLTRA